MKKIYKIIIITAFLIFNLSNYFNICFASEDLQKSIKNFETIPQKFTSKIDLENQNFIYDKYLIICDKEYENKFLKCNEDKIEPKEIIVQKILINNSDTKNNVLLIMYKDEGKTFIVTPYSRIKNILTAQQIKYFIDKEIFEIKKFQEQNKIKIPSDFKFIIELLNYTVIAIFIIYLTDFFSNKNLNSFFSNSKIFIYKYYLHIFFVINLFIIFYLIKLNYLENFIKFFNGTLSSVLFNTFLIGTIIIFLIIKNKEITPPRIKNTTYFFLISLLSLFSIINYKYNFSIVVYIVFLFLILSSFEFEKINFKLIIYVVLINTAISTYLFYFYNLKPEFVSLSEDSYVKIPVEINLENKHQIFKNDINELPKYPIYVNEFLAFYPNKQNIYNKNISKLDLEKHGLIISKNLEDLQKILNENNELHSKIKSNVVNTNYFLIDKLPKRPSYILSIEIKCTSNINKNIVLNSKSIYLVKECDRNNKVVTISPKINYLQIKENHLNKLEINSENLISLTLLDENEKKVANVKFIDIKENLNFYTLEFNVNNSSDIVSYSSNTLEFNLSEDFVSNLNYVLKNDYIGYKNIRLSSTDYPVFINKN